MLINKDIAITTPKVLLVPYDAHHVERYHQWMEDPAIQEATASEPLTLEEERENQQSWRDSHNKLTFIVCRPLPMREGLAKRGDSLDADPVVGGSGAYAGEIDTPQDMVGDVNLFLTPYDEDEDGDEDGGRGDDHPRDNGAGVKGTETAKLDKNNYCKAEIDIMIASKDDRGKGYGKAAVEALLMFLRRNLDEILREYSSSGSSSSASLQDYTTTKILRHLFAKMNADNKGSIALFRSLGFTPTPGGVDYFGELTVELCPFPEAGGKDGDEIGGKEDGYREIFYDRSRLAT